MQKWLGEATPCTWNFESKWPCWSEIWTISCDTSETVYEIGCELLLIINRKLHTGFRLVPISMTFNDLKRRNSPYFAFFSPNSTDFQADYITVVEDRPNFRKILSPSSSLLLLAKTIMHPAARSLCDSWASCYIWHDCRVWLFRHLWSCCRSGHLRVRKAPWRRLCLQVFSLQSW